MVSQSPALIRSTQRQTRLTPPDLESHLRTHYTHLELSRGEMHPVQTGWQGIFRLPVCGRGVGESWFRIHSPMSRTPGSILDLVCSNHQPALCSMLVTKASGRCFVHKSSQVWWLGSHNASYHCSIRTWPPPNAIRHILLLWKGSYLGEHIVVNIGCPPITVMGFDERVWCCGFSGTLKCAGLLWAR